MLTVIPGLPNYFVSPTTGDIYSNALHGRRNAYRSKRLMNHAKRPKKLHPCTNRYGILVVGIYREIRAVADLGCLTINGERPGRGYTVEHIDRDLRNCKPENLRWNNRELDIKQVLELGYKAEQVRPIANHPGYWAIDTGEIVSTKQRKPRILKAAESHFGYLRVSLRMPGYSRGRNVYVHRAIFESFNGETPAGNQIRHLNSDPKDNRLCNLKAGSHIENNLIDKVENGTVKLSFEKATEIRTLIAGGATRRELAQRFDCSRSLIGVVQNNRVWRESPF